jgi:hypothetical protein
MSDVIAGKRSASAGVSPFNSVSAADVWIPPCRRPITWKNRDAICGGFTAIAAG